MPSTTKPVAGYFRVSKARDEMSAPDIYRGQIEDYCTYKGFQLAEVFSDIDLSARKGSRIRPGLAKLLERRREFSAIVTPKLSRFGRSLKDLAHIFETCDLDGIALVFLDIDVDTSTSTGRLVRNIMASLAEWESDLISERWKDTARHLARHGRRNGGQSTPLAYRYVKETKSYEVVEGEVATVREVFDRYLRGESVSSIVRDFNRRGVPTKTGGMWHASTIADMLELEMFAGLRRFDGELVRGNWRPIIDRETFERASGLRQRQRAAYSGKPREGKGMYLLSGLLRCGVCGAAMHRNTTGERQADQYACPNSRPRQIQQGKPRCSGGVVSERRAEDFIVKAFFDKVGDLHAAHVNRKVKRVSGERSQRREVSELDKVDAQIARLVDLVAIGKATHRAVDRKLQQLEERRHHLEQEQSTRQLEERREEDIESFRKRVADLPGVWELATLDQRKTMLRLAIDGVVVTGKQPKRFEIQWADWLKEST
jgi:site-specific DNA recombinase